LVLDSQTEMEMKEAVHFSLEIFYHTTKMATAWTHATIGLIDTRTTPQLVRGFVNELEKMMEVEGLGTADN